MRVRTSCFPFFVYTFSGRFHCEEKVYSIKWCETRKLASKTLFYLLRAIDMQLIILYTGTTTTTHRGMMFTARKDQC